MLHQIHIAKAGKEAFLEVNDALLSDDDLLSVIKEGLKVVLNAKMSSVGPVTKLEGLALAEATAKALDIANKNLTDLLAGEFKFPGAKSKKPASRDVTNEAMRLAREFLRDQIKLAGITISHVPPKDITAGAKSLIESDPSYLAKAEETVKARATAPTENAIHIDLAALGIKPDPKKVAAAAEAKTKRTEQLSAAKSGKVKGRTSTAAKAKPTATAADVLAGLTARPGHSPAVTH
jgi:hypothetical protein